MRSSVASIPFEQTTHLMSATGCNHSFSNHVMMAPRTRSSQRRSMDADSLADGARGCRRMHEPGKMSARFRLADAAGMASAKPFRSSGVFIRMSRHLSSCIHARLLMLSKPTDMLSKPTDMQKESAPVEVRDCCFTKPLDWSKSHLAKITI